MRRPACAAVVCVVLFAWSAAAERLPVTSFTTVNGLPHDRIKRIVRDSKGFLWFGTATGLSRFDGERFVTYTVAQGLSHASINDLVEARDGTYWIATNGGGVCRFQPMVQGRETSKGAAPRHAFTCLRLDNAAANRVNAVLVDRRGRIWAGTDRGLYRLDPDRSNSFAAVASKASAANVWALAEDRDGDVWVGHANGLARHTATGTICDYDLPQQSGSSNVWALLSDRAGRLWFGRDGGLYVVLPLPARVADAHQPLWHTLLRTSSTSDADQTLPTQPGEARIWTTNEGLVSSRPGAITETSDGHIWIASGVWTTAGRGLSEFDGRRLRAYTVEHGLSDDPIVAVAEDSSGNLWLGTHATGAIRVAKSGVIAYGERDGLAPGQVFAIVSSEGRDFFTVTSGLWIHRFDGARFVGVRPNIGAAEWPGWDRAPLLDRRGEWWIPTARGLFRFGRVARLEELARARPIAVYGARDGLPGDDVLTPFEDSRGDVWFGVIARDSVVRWERASESFHVYGARDGLSDIGLAVAFSEDRSGNVWIGGRNGAVARFRNERFDVFRAGDGVPLGQISAMHVDGEGRLWIGSRDAAIGFASPSQTNSAQRDTELARVDEPNADRPQIVQYPPQLLSGLGVRCIKDDGEGGLYIGGDRGVQRFDPRNDRIRRLTRADGLPSEDVEIAFRDAEGAMWFGTWNGVARYRRDGRREGTLPTVLIGDLRIRGETHPIAELGQAEIAGLELQPDQNQLDIEFFAVAFAPGRAPLYQWRLEGADADWGPPAERQRVTYVSMSPGQYRFQVRAVDSDGVVTKPAVISFAIMPPIWQRAWFIAVALAALMLLAVAAHRARVARLLAVERLRTTIATDLHDDIGASLSQIAILSEVVRQRRPGDPAIADPLSRIASTSRELVDAMSDIVWAINPQRDTLGDLVQRMRRFASDVLSARGTAFTFDAPTDTTHLRIGVDVRRHVFLIFKEAVNNLARHSQAAQAAIALSVDGGQLLLNITDDGKGFDPEASAAGHGLASMRARARAMGATLEIEARPGSGARLRLEVPVGRRAGRFKRRTAARV